MNALTSPQCTDNGTPLAACPANLASLTHLKHHEFEEVILPIGNLAGPRAVGGHYESHMSQNIRSICSPPRSLRNRTQTSPAQQLAKRAWSCQRMLDIQSMHAGAKAEALLFKMQGLTRL